MKSYPLGKKGPEFITYPLPFPFLCTVGFKIELILKDLDKT